jgi:hypothetical protein
MRNWLREHRRAAACAVLAAVWLSLPSVLMGLQRRFYRQHFPAYFAGWTNNGTFSPMDSFSQAEDNYYYAARIRQAASHFMPSDPYIRGNHSLSLALIDAVTFEAYALLWRLAGNERRGWMLSQFVFILLWVPCLYFILLSLGCERAPAVWLAVLCTLFADLARVLLFFTNGGPLQILRAAFQYAFWFLGSYNYFFGPTRLTGPLFTYPCLFLAGLAFVRGAQKKDGACLALAGVAGGLLAYVHTDVFLAYEGAAALFCAWSVLDARRAWRPPALMLALSLVVALPWALFCRPTADDIALLGLREGHRFFWGSLIFPLGAALALRRRGRGAAWVWCACLLAAMFIGANTAVVTGWWLIQGHWFYIGNTYLALMAGVWLTGKIRFLREDDWLWLTALTFLLSLPRLVSYGAQHYWVEALPAAEQQAYEWLDKNTPDEAVVAALSAETEHRISAHTHDCLAVSFLFPVISDISISENAKRLVYTLSLYGVALEDYLRQGSDASSRWEDKLWLREVDQRGHERDGVLWTHFCAMPHDRITELLQRTAQEPVEKFPVDYLWVGDFERSLIGDPARLPGREKLVKVFENSAATIFKIAP